MPKIRTVLALCSIPVFIAITGQVVENRKQAVKREYIERCNAESVKERIIDGVPYLFRYIDILVEDFSISSRVDINIYVAPCGKTPVYFLTDRNGIPLPVCAHADQYLDGIPEVSPAGAALRTYIQEEEYFIMADFGDPYCPLALY